MLKRILPFFSFLLLSLQSMAQNAEEVEMADGLRSNGKIYVVVIVICLLFLGIVGYLIALDRKIKKLEDK